MFAKLIRLVKHWVIVQIVFSQSAAGRKRVRTLIGAWLAVLAVIFVLLSALAYVDGNRLNKSYTTAPEDLKSTSPAR